jgi:hypothetical protein
MGAILTRALKDAEARGDRLTVGNLEKVMAIRGGECAKIVMGSRSTIIVPNLKPVLAEKVGLVDGMGRPFR